MTRRSFYTIKRRRGEKNGTTTTTKIRCLLATVLRPIQIIIGWTVLMPSPSSDLFISLYCPNNDNNINYFLKTIVYFFYII